MHTFTRIFIAGGGGFIGSHFVERLLADEATEKVTVFDNFSSGGSCLLKSSEADSRLHVVRGDIGDLDSLCAAMAGHDCVLHLASNPDIARAAVDPMIDFRAGTVLTQHIIEAVRRASVSKILYASGSGVYGDMGESTLVENRLEKMPISTYGASKLAGEALLSSYAHMFGINSLAFRFANVVGARQTHGVCLDFIKKLRNDGKRLAILGDGTQSKSYIHVTDVVAAVLLAAGSVKSGFDCFNVSTPDHISVTEIARIACTKVLGGQSVQFDYSGGDRGWKGDIPVVRICADKIRGLGWQPRFNSYQAIEKSIEELL